MKDLLRVNDLRVEFDIHDGVLKAVDGVSFRVRAGGTTALVGESGSGKSVCSQAIMRILPKIGRIAGGEILFDDPANDDPPLDLTTLPPDGPKIRAVRGGRISMIFQEPMTSLSPLHTVGDQVSEALHLHRKVDRQAGRELATDMLRLVGFPDPARAMRTAYSTGSSLLCGASTAGSGASVARLSIWCSRYFSSIVIRRSTIRRRSRSS